MCQALLEVVRRRQLPRIPMLEEKLCGPSDRFPSSLRLATSSLFERSQTSKEMFPSRLPKSHQRNWQTPDLHLSSLRLRRDRSADLSAPCHRQHSSRSAFADYD